MGRIFAKALSYLFHPLLMPFYGSLIFFFYDGYLSLLLKPKARLIILSVIFVMTVIVPALLVLLLKHYGMIKSFHMDKKEERTLPFLGTGFAFYLAYMLIKSFEIPGYYSIFLLGATLLILIVLIINKFWKISIHMAGLGGLTGVFTAMTPYPFGVDHLFVYLTVLIAGFTGYARLRITDHSQAQVYTGYLTGLAFMFGLFLMLA